MIKRALLFIILLSVPALARSQGSDSSRIPGKDWEIYTDRDFGFSFYYPKTWRVSASNGYNNNRATNDNSRKYGTVEITNFGATRNDPYPDSISIKESVGAKVTIADAKFGYTILYYDEIAKQWMEGLGLAPDEVDKPDAVHPATPSFKTISGLPVFPSTGRWKTDIIPLSHTKFLILNIGGSGDRAALDPLASGVTEAGKSEPESLIEPVIRAESRDDDLAPGPPGAVHLDSLSPDSGPAGTVVTIKGRGFASVPSEHIQQDSRWQSGQHVSVSLGSTFLWAGIPSSDSRLTVTIPARKCAYTPSSSILNMCNIVAGVVCHDAVGPDKARCMESATKDCDKTPACSNYSIITPGDYQIRVNVIGQREANPFPFKVTGEPVSTGLVIDSLEPASGPVYTHVVVHGRNFRGVEALDLGGISPFPLVSYVSADGTILAFTVPQRNPGEYYFSIRHDWNNGNDRSNTVKFTVTK